MKSKRISSQCGAPLHQDRDKDPTLSLDLIDTLTHDSLCNPPSRSFSLLGIDEREILNKKYGGGVVFMHVLSVNCIYFHPRLYPPLPLVDSPAPFSIFLEFKLLDAKFSYLYFGSYFETKIWVCLPLCSRVFPHNSRGPHFKNQIFIVLLSTFHLGEVSSPPPPSMRMPTFIEWGLFDPSKPINAPDPAEPHLKFLIALHFLRQ